MKKIFVLIAILIFQFNYGFATNWEDFVIKPDCRDSQEEWTGPHEDIICSDDYEELVCNGCCYTIVYYDRWVEEDNGGVITEDYEMTIVGIFWEGVNCDNCDKTIIAELYYYNKLEELNENYDLYTRLGGTGNTLSEVLQFFTPSRCYYEGFLCDQDYRCCEVVYQIDFDQQGNIESIDPVVGSVPDMFPPCSTGCTPSCNDYPFMYKGVIDCSNMPCNEGLFSNEIYNVSLDLDDIGCSQCTLKVFYRYREVNEPGCHYYDHQLEYFELEGPGCEYCTLGVVQLWSLAIDVLLKKGLVIDLEEDECKTNIRIVNATCWLEFNEGVYTPCSMSDCCYAIYEVCNIENQKGEYEYTYNLLVTGGQPNPNCDPTAPCHVVCGEYPNP
jgi:hypothetical protein